MQTLKNNRIKAIYKSKYFYPIIIGAVFCVLSLVALYIGSAPSFSQLEEGDVSLRTIYAPYDFSYPTTVDQEKTQKLRAELESKVFPVYDIEASRQEKAFSKLDVFFASVREAKDAQSLTGKEMSEFLEKRNGITLSEKDFSKFVTCEELARIKKISKDALENIFLIGIISAKDKQELLRGNKKKVSLRNTRFNIERELNVKDLVEEKEARKILSGTLERFMPQNKSMREAVYNLVKNEALPNVRYDKDETLDRKEKAREQVPPVYRRKVVKKNELIVEKGQRLTENDITKLTQITRIDAVVNRTSYLSGLFILLLGLVLTTVIYFMLFEKETIGTAKHVLLITINAFLAILVSLIVIQIHQSEYLIPLAGVGMILVLLLNVNVALMTSLALAVYIGFIAGSKLELSFMLFIGTAVGIYIVRGARRRSQIFLAGFTVAVVNFFAIAGTGLLNNTAKETILRGGIYGIANGIISAFITIGLLPVFEYVFNFISNITLLELSDSSHPILKELTIKAPGTYHHSTLVGNLAEEASNAIGANSLLARVGSYYHDIGKIEKAEYFVENEMTTRSKHEKLAPSMSALIITNHTKDGIEFAKKYKLNSAIVDFIGQHHGTSLIYYFYQKALEKIKTEKQLVEEEFRYPGPKPQTKEVAIVLLADSVEASSRMLSDPTPARIRGLVQKIINNKFIDGQLDECDLTLKDLNKISESFVRVLTGVFHTRLDYPEVKSKKERANAAKAKNKQSK